MTRKNIVDSDQLFVALFPSSASHVSKKAHAQTIPKDFSFSFCLFTVFGPLLAHHKVFLDT